MEQSIEVVVHVGPAPGDDDEALGDATSELRRYLGVLDLASVAQLRRPRGPDDPPAAVDTKGGVLTDLLTVTGGLVISVESLTALRELVLALAEWRSRGRHPVKVTIGGNELDAELTPQQQERIVDAFFSSLPPRP